MLSSRPLSFRPLALVLATAGATLALAAPANAQLSFGSFATQGDVIPAATRYARASDLDHALELLGEPEARVIAGGQSLIPVMKLRLARPSLVVDISRLDLRGVADEGDRDGVAGRGRLTGHRERIVRGVGQVVHIADLVAPVKKILPLPRVSIWRAASRPARKPE